jgi:putative glutamine amidotransferase
MNVALGGSLHQAVHEVGRFADHREDEDDPLPAQYAPAHAVTLTPRGVLAQILQTDRIEVNSLHGQGVNRLAPGLAVEGVAPDGLIEAFSVPAAPGFALAVQWHPEWQAESNPVSLQLFRAFGDAARAWRARRGGIPDT